MLSQSVSSNLPISSTTVHGRSAVRVRSPVRACLRNSSSADIRSPEMPIDSRRFALSLVRTVMRRRPREAAT